VPLRLLLVRHAQAGNAPLDRDRPLTDRGLRQAAGIGSWLAGAGLVPDRAVVSPALRAVQTWETAVADISPDIAADLEPRIYENTVEDLLAVINETSDVVQTLALFGHNPSIGALAADLDGGPDARHDLEIGFPAGAVAVFVLDTPFADVAAGTATLETFRPPTD
jgi:phosphohistidine phosphatase